MKPNKQLRAWRLLGRLDGLRLNNHRQIMGCKPKDQQSLIQYSDTLQRRKDFLNKILSL